MKFKPVLIVCSLAAIFAAYSCSKTSQENPVPVEPPVKGKKSVNIVLGGEISTSESPLPNARAMHSYVLARTQRDSTIYAVDVRTPDMKPYAAGVFNVPVINIELPDDSSFIVRAAAIRKGTGFGLWYTLSADNRQLFERPLNRSLENKMVYNVKDSLFLGDFTWARLFASDTSAVPAFGAYFPEIDSYWGSVENINNKARRVDIPMKRISFGIKFNAINFTEGRLIVDYQSSMRKQILTPENIGNSLRVFTADEYKKGDVLWGWERILFVLKWEKPDGTIINLGEKELTPPQRNYVLTVNVTLPTTSATVNDGVKIIITENDWSSINIINI